MAQALKILMKYVKLQRNVDLEHIPALSRISPFSPRISRRYSRRLSLRKARTNTPSGSCRPRAVGVLVHVHARRRTPRHPPSLHQAPAAGSERQGGAQASRGPKSSGAATASRASRLRPLRYPTGSARTMRCGSRWRSRAGQRLEKLAAVLEAAA